MLSLWWLILILGLAYLYYLNQKSPESFQSGSVPWYLSPEIIEGPQGFPDPSIQEDKIRTRNTEVETVADIMEGSLGHRDQGPNKGVGPNPCQWFVHPSRKPGCPRHLGVGGCRTALPSALHYFNTFNRERGFIPEADYIDIHRKESGGIRGNGSIKGSIHYRKGSVDDGFGGLRSGTCLYDLTPYRYEKYPSPTGEMLNKLKPLPETRLSIKLQEAENL